VERSHPRMFTIVLTGGIASGKTVVSNCFAELGASVIDTDVIARELVQPGKPALDEIVRTFGREMLDAGGNLDRTRLRNLVFKDPASRKRLEAILHPRIADEALRRAGRAEGPYCILVIPLYAESSRYPWIDRVLVVDAKESTRMKRLMDRDRTDREQALAIMRAQAGREQRLAIADDVINNDGTMDELLSRVGSLHETYIVLAKQARRSNEQG